MVGYWGLVATNKALVQMDGKMWYKTGDSGYVTDDNFLYYTGRMSDNYKLSNGNLLMFMLSRQKLENMSTTEISCYGEMVWIIMY